MQKQRETDTQSHKIHTKTQTLNTQKRTHKHRKQTHKESPKNPASVVALLPGSQVNCLEHHKRTLLS